MKPVRLIYSYDIFINIPTDTQLNVIYESLDRKIDR